MSNSPQNLDQLLSGYLDDTLDVDERAEIERIVSSDPAVATDLAEMQELRYWLRELGSDTPATRLDDQFADRVLSAAVDRARNEGLSDSHPLIRLASQPSVRPVDSADERGRSFAGYVGLFAAVAASVAIALVAVRRDDEQLEPIRLADQTNQELNGQADQEPEPTALAAGPPETPTRADESPMASRNGTARTADSVLQSLADLANPESVEDRSPMVDSWDVAAASTPPASMPNAKSIAAAGSPTAETVSPTTQLGAILVLDVRLTPEGQMSDAIRTAMEKAGLDRASETDLPPGLVASLTATNDELISEQVTVMYLKSSAKTLDRFYLNLLADSQGISAVGMSLAMNAPILKIVQSIAPDPTTIRHQSSSLELMNSGGGSDRLAGELSRLNFVPLDRQSASDLSPSGPDVPAQILVLVR